MVQFTACTTLIILFPGQEGGVSDGLGIEKRERQGEADSGLEEKQGKEGEEHGKEGESKNRDVIGKKRRMGTRRQREYHHGNYKRNPESQFVLPHVI